MKELREKETDGTLWLKCNACNVWQISGRLACAQWMACAPVLPAGGPIFDAHIIEHIARSLCSSASRQPEAQGLPSQELIGTSLQWRVHDMRLRDEIVDTDLADAYHYDSALRADSV